MNRNASTIVPLPRHLKYAPNVPLQARFSLVLVILSISPSFLSLSLKKACPSTRTSSSSNALPPTARRRTCQAERTQQRVNKSSPSSTILQLTREFTAADSSDAYTEIRRPTHTGLANLYVSLFPSNSFPRIIAHFVGRISDPAPFGLVCYASTNMLLSLTRFVQTRFDDSIDYSSSPSTAFQQGVSYSPTSS